MGSLHSWNLIDQVSKLEWSKDSSLIMCSQNKRGIVQIFNIKELKWDCKITLGPCGLSGSWFSQDSRHILTVCQFQIRLNIWSLLDKSIFAVPSPKFSSKGIAFSKCGNFTAVLKRIDSRDSVIILDNDFNSVSEFMLKSIDTENIIWTNDNFYILAYQRTNWLVYSPEGELIYDYNYPGLNISNIFNSPNGCYTAIATCNKSVIVMHHITWNVLSTFQLELDMQGKDTVIYNETETLEEDGLSYSYTMSDTPIKIPGALDERIPSLIKWSHNERYIACKFGIILFRCHTKYCFYLGLCTFIMEIYYDTKTIS